MQELLLRFHTPQEFAQQVSFVVGLETGGKLSPQAAYEQIEAL